MNTTSATRPILRARCEMEDLREVARDRSLSPKERASAVEAVMSLVSDESLGSFRRATEAGTVTCWDMEGQTICDAIMLRLNAVTVYALDGDPALLAAMEAVDEVLDKGFMTLETALEREFWDLIYFQSFEQQIPQANHWWGYRVGRDEPLAWGDDP